MLRIQLDTLLREALASLPIPEGLEEIVAHGCQLERTKNSKHGDFSTNIALRLAKSLNQEPRAFAEKIVESLKPSPLVEKAEIAGPGFINFILTATAYHEEITSILKAGKRYGSSNTGANCRVLVEYISANPTGPLHVGHGRHAAYGASISNLLRATGHDVHEEYYVNDAGRQMDILTISVWFRYAELCGQFIPFPENAYQGNYVKEIAGILNHSRGENLLPDSNDLKKIIEHPNADPEKQLDLIIKNIKNLIGLKQFNVVLKLSLETILKDIKEDLASFGVRPKHWYSETSLVETNAIECALASLKKKKMIYKKNGATWFRSKNYGDEKDRVVVRENGAKTYFASDIAYHYDKRKRDYTHLLDVLGADHHGYVARIRAGLQAMGEPAECFEPLLVQFVTLYRGQVKVQMSTRTGEYVTLRELREEVGNDAARFFYVSRSNGQHLDFDLELAKTQSNDNPVYYIQYAHARIASILRQIKNPAIDFQSTKNLVLNQLTEASEHSLMVALSRYPEVVQLASDKRAPQHVVHYLRDTAACFHSYYNAHQILVEDSTLRKARIALVLATQQIIHNGLTLLGVSAPERM